MSYKEIYELIDDINSIDTDFEARLKLMNLAVRCIKRMGGIIDAKLKNMEMGK